MPNDTNTELLSIDDLKFYLVPFVNSMPEGFIMIDRKGTIVVANSKCSSMFEYKEDELTGKNISVLVPSMYSNIHNKHIEKFFSVPHARPMGTSGMQLFGLKQNGIHFPIEVSLGFYNAKEGMYGMAFVIDITNKQLLDNALKQSEQRFKQIFQAGPIAMCITNTINDKFIDINERFLKITKYSKDEVIGDSSINLETLLDADSFEKIVSELETKTGIRDMEGFLKTKHGKFIDILLSVEKIRLGTGTNYIIMFSDISDRKQAEKQLEEERNFIKTIQETTDALIMVQDLKGKIITFNKGCEKLTGYKLKEVRGKTLWELPFIPKEQAEISKEIFEEIKTNGISSQNEVKWNTKDGNKKSIRWSNNVLRNEKNEIAFIVKTGIDITESKQHELNLLNAVVQGEEKERTRLSKELHDGLSPLLSSVRNHLEVLNSSSDTLDAKNKKYFSNSISLLNNALDEVRTMSKDLMPSSLEDYGLITALKQLCERLDKTNNVKIIFYSSINKKRFERAIEIGLYRIAQEIINNALKHSGAGSINVQLVKHKNSIVLNIEDNGVGFLPAVNMDKGLGLRNITSRVKSLSGFTSIDSRVKKGTSITVEVPIK